MVLIADDWSPIAGCYGDTVVRTPRIDAAAGRGMVFDRAFCASPSCAVSRATILTGLHAHTHGQYGHTHGVHGFRTHDSVMSVPRVLAASGVRTACLGKLHTAPAAVYPFGTVEEGLMWNTAALAGRAASWLREGGSAPFYLHAASAFPHRAGSGESEDYGIGRDPLAAAEPPFDPGSIPVPDWLPDHPDVRRDLAGYYAGIACWDRFVGAALDALDASGRGPDTLVIVMSDHGMPFPGAKASAFEGGHRCPLIVIAPGAPGGRRSAAMVSWVDLAPTVYEWLGAPAGSSPADLPGRSLLPVLAGDDAGRDEVWYSHCFHEVTNYFPYRVLRRRRWKYVLNLAHRLDQPLPSDLFRSLTWAAVRRDGLDRLGRRPRDRFLRHDHEELFDLESDPVEAINRIADPGAAAVAAEMRAAMLAFRRRTRDPWLEVSFQEGELDRFDPV